MSFDVLARHYRWMEFVLAGEKLQRCRTAFLDSVSQSENVLIVGEGNGRFLVECCKQLPRAQITVVDASERMLKLSRNRVAQNESSRNRIQFIHADATEWHAEKSRFDLIVTHFFLDCFSELQLGNVIGALADAARPEAAWLIADFQIPAHGWKRFRARMIHALMYFFFRAVTKISARELALPDALLSKHNFELIERRTSDWDLLRTDLWRRRARHSVPFALTTNAWALRR